MIVYNRIVVTRLKHLPAEFVARLQLIVPKSRIGKIEEGLKTRRPTTFRRNTSVCSKTELEDRLKRGNIRAVGVSWYPDAYILESPDLRKFQETDIYGDGAVYVQGLSSMVPALVLDPKPGERILDLCAAPGSKTTQMACLMKNEGVIVANDASPIRSLKLRHNVDMQHAANVSVSVNHGEIVWQQNPESFDRVLVDVPCSMEGTFSDDDPKSYEHWAPQKPKMLGKKQRWLLRSAVSACRVGGTIVYSTCTMSPEENEAVVDWILTKEHGKLETEEIAITGMPLEPALDRWKEKMFAPGVKNARRIYPSALMEGFFVVKFRKTGRSVPEAAFSGSVHMKPIVDDGDDKIL